MFRFPLWLGVTGVFLPVITVIEGLVPLLPVFPSLGPIDSGSWKALFDFWVMSAFYGVPIGVVLGLAASGCWMLRRGRGDWAGAARFGPNLRWCLALAFLVGAVNDVLFFVVLERGSPGYWAAYFPFALAVVLNLVALACATIRTITTDDVLSPRSVLAKMRHSALES